LLYLALKTTQCIFERLTFLNANFSHLVFTVLPLHVANIAINRIVLRWQPFISAYWQSLLADPSTEVKLCFFRNDPFRPLWETRDLLLECPGRVLLGFMGT
jgi:hypothetical protein